MMPYTLLVLLSYSIFIAAIIALARFRQMSRVFLPFILFIITGAVNEITSTVVISQGISTSFNNNVYMLLEALLLLWQFKRWGNYIACNTGFSALAISVMLLWLLEIFYYGLFRDLVYFSLYYCFIIVLLSVLAISRLVVSYNRPMHKKPVFIICTAFLMYFMCRLLLDSSWYLGITISNTFQRAVFDIMACINFFINLVYCMAILWIPTKQKYSESSQSHVYCSF